MRMVGHLFIGVLGSRQFVESEIKTAPAIEDSQDDDVLASHGEGNGRTPLESDGAQPCPQILAHRAPTRERNEFTAETRDSGDIGRRDFLPGPIRNPCKNLVEIGFRGLGKENASQVLTRRFRLLSRAIARGVR